MVFDCFVLLFLSSGHRRVPGEQHDGCRRHAAPRGGERRVLAPAERSGECLVPPWSPFPYTTEPALSLCSTATTDPCTAQT